MNTHDSPVPSVNRLKSNPLKATIRTAVAISGMWLLYSKFIIDHRLPMDHAIPTERVEYYPEEIGKLSYYVDNQVEGRPLLLLHSINAAASAFEMRPLFQRLRNIRPVYALDLPGFGFSERSQRDYSPQLFAQAILDLVANRIGTAVDVVALSLSSEFIARAAMMRPDLFHSMVMISPSGLGESMGRRAASTGGPPAWSSLLHRIVSFPLWSQALFDLVASRASIEYFLAQSFVGEPDPALADYSFVSAHQPGAKEAPLHFLSGRLFTSDAAEALYSKIRVPGLILYDQDFYVSFERLPALLASNPTWRAVQITPTMGLPHFERLPETVAAMITFWQAIDTSAA